MVPRAIRRAGRSGLRIVRVGPVRGARRGIRFALFVILIRFLALKCSIRYRPSDAGVASFFWLVNTFFKISVT